MENKLLMRYLSRMPEGVELANLTVPTLLDVVVIKEEVCWDPKLMEIIQKLWVDEDNVSNFSLHRVMLKYKGRLVVSKSSLLPSILHTYHDSVFGGHSGFLRMYKRLIGELYWEGMKQDVKKYVGECSVCQKKQIFGYVACEVVITVEYTICYLGRCIHGFYRGITEVSRV